jgi:hypothetical protein
MLSNNIKSIFYLSTSIGFIYGIAFYPIWTENIEFAQHLLNLKECNYYVSRHIEILESFTITPIITALFINMGVSIELISRVTVGLICSFTFLTISITFYFFINKSLICIALPFSFLAISFATNHYYPISFPIRDNYFGQLGMYLTLIVIILIHSKKINSSIIILGFLPSFHITWALVSHIYFVIWAQHTNYKIFNIQNIIKISIGYFVTIFSYIFYKFYLIKPLGDTLTNYNDESLFLNKWVETFGQSRHSKFIIEDPNYLFESLSFFSTEIILVLLLVIIKLFDNKDAKILTFINVYLKFVILLSCFKIVTDIFHEYMPWQVLMLHPNKLLNINTIVLTVMLIAYPIKIYIKNKNHLSLLNICLIFLLISSVMFASNSPYNRGLDLIPNMNSFYLNTENMFSLQSLKFIVELYKILLILILISSILFISRYKFKFDKLLIYFVSLLFVSSLIYKHSSDGKNIYLTLNSVDKLKEVEEIILKNGNITVLPIGLKGYFNPLIVSSNICFKNIPELGHPYSPSSITMSNYVNKDFFDKDDFNMLNENYNLYENSEYLIPKLKKSFESKIKKDWIDIKNKYEFNIIATNVGWELDLDLIFTNDSIHLYLIDDDN